MSVDFANFPGKYTRMVLSGGGSKGLAILGALHYIDECKGLDAIEEYWGTSVGSIIILLLSIGYTPFEIFHQFFMMNYFTSDTGVFQMESVFTSAALCPIETFGGKVRTFLERKLGAGANPTFFDLHTQFHKKIHVYGANVDTMSGVCFNVDTYPLMHVLEAIEISCDLPYLFTRKKFEGQTYVDGGFINNYAINDADNGRDHVLGICVINDSHTLTPAPGASDHIGWIYRLLFMPIMELHRERISRLSDKCTNIELTVTGVSIIELSPDSKKKIQIFTSGYTQAKTKLLSLEDEYKIVRKLLEYTDTEAEIGSAWSGSPEPMSARAENRCTECGVNLGECNPRQLCGKTYCLQMDLFESFS